MRTVYGWQDGDRSQRSAAYAAISSTVSVHISIYIISAASQLAWVGDVNLFRGGVWEVMGVHSTGELIPVEGGENSSFNGTFFKGIVKTTWRSR